MFDISESKRAEREWLRWHLKKFNYLMIQKSVWVGPSPIPKEFLDYIKSIGLKEFGDWLYFSKFFIVLDKSSYTKRLSQLRNIRSN